MQCVRSLDNSRIFNRLVRAVKKLTRITNKFLRKQFAVAERERADVEFVCYPSCCLSLAAPILKNRSKRAVAENESKLLAGIRCNFKQNGKQGEKFIFAQLLCALQQLCIGIFAFLFQDHGVLL